MTQKCSLLLREAKKFPSTIFENKVVRKILTQIKFVGDGTDEHHHNLYSCSIHRVNFKWYISTVHWKQVASNYKKGRTTWIMTI